MLMLPTPTRITRYTEEDESPGYIVRFGSEDNESSDTYSILNPSIHVLYRDGKVFDSWISVGRSTISIPFN